MKGLLFAGLIATVSGAPLAAQGASTQCYPLRSDSLHKVYLENIRNYTSDPDSVWTASGAALGFPRVAANQVTLSRDKNLCKTAAQKFAANVPTQVSAPPSGKVYVFPIGTTHYYVVDPDYYASPNRSFSLLFNSSWTLITRTR